MFNGNSRFKLLRRLGAGGMGVVYEALDQQRQTRVALKTLQHADADLLYRLKREFRSLRDVVHRNVISLNELFEEDGHWFFTMELLEGDHLLDYLQRATSAEIPRTPDSTVRWRLGKDASLQSQPTSGASSSVSFLQGIDHVQIRDVFGQIAEGLSVIHDAGKVHRDIKPSNIIVTREHRAVILDFGLVTEHWDGVRSSQGEIVGSVLYMAPEQAAGRAVGPAADWYSVGVMLYEVVAGRRPFDGAIGVVLAAKQYREARDLRTLVPTCPDDLAELCMRLLRLDPERRPEGPEVLRQLGVTKQGAAAGVAWSPNVRPSKRVFVGRERELRELHRALDDVTSGGSVTAFVHGESGIGKTTLLQHFAAGVAREHPEMVVLSGQCREHE
ncbi:MAG TPA: serine/threonine-protein kinase, partial [Kofleriaceae bacterium]|nr:serine/threonine-protein kinase [Kofleriaceae bacterium]